MAQVSLSNEAFVAQDRAVAFRECDDTAEEPSSEDISRKCLKIEDTGRLHKDAELGEEGGLKRGPSNSTQLHTAPKHDTQHLATAQQSRLAPVQGCRAKLFLLYWALPFSYQGLRKTGHVAACQSLDTIEK